MTHRADDPAITAITRMYGDNARLASTESHLESCTISVAPRAPSVSRLRCAETVDAILSGRGPSTLPPPPVAPGTCAETVDAILARRR